MRNKHQKRKVFIDFPFSFFKEHGKLDIINMQPIKENVFQIYDGNRNLILKRYANPQIAFQQIELFSKVKKSFITQFIPFPNHLPYLNDENHGIWTLTQFINGQLLDYGDRRDREAASHILNDFHKASEGTEIQNVILKNPLYLKWSLRYEQFRTYQWMFFHYGYDCLFNDLRNTIECNLEAFEAINWGKIEQDSLKRWTWIHGDVAPHNIIRDRNEEVHLIDFDLLAQAPVVYEWIQLVHRWTGFIKHPEELLQYEGIKSQLNYNSFRIGVQIPGDFMREWLYFIRLNKNLNHIPVYLENMKNKWDVRKKFVEEFKLMLI